MKQIIVALLFICTQLIFGQSEFTFTEEGITPKHITSELEGITKNQLYKKALIWVQSNFKNPNEVITSRSENEFILNTDVKPNYISIRKDYYYVKYGIKISFENGLYTFEPLEVFTKLNSKYDMGWKKFDLKDGSSLFKRGKVIKSTKPYVKKIPSLFNELNDALLKELKSM